MNRIPNWAGALAISCLILVIGAWGGRLSVNVSENERGIAICRELKQELRRLTILIERTSYREVGVRNE